MKKTIQSIWLFWMVTIFAYADGRYTQINPIADNEQYFPLAQVVTIHIPKQYTTIKQAINYVLLGTGYQQAEEQMRSSEDLAFIQLPLPTINREFKDVSILEILNALGGYMYVPIIDPVHRLVAYETNETVLAQ